MSTIYRRGLAQILAMATLFGRQARFESEMPRTVKRSRNYGPFKKYQEMARRRRQIERGIIPRSQVWGG